MKKTITTIQLPPEEGLFSKIYLLRNQKVLLDEDLAVMYGVPTKVLNQAVKRNAERFPEDFMFQLSEEEYFNLKSQFVTSSWGADENLLWLLLNKEYPCFPVYFDQHRPLR